MILSLVLCDLRIIDKEKEIPSNKAKQSQGFLGSSAGTCLKFTQLLRWWGLNGVHLGGCG